MATPPILDFDRLLAPISSDAPTGRDLRADPSPVSDYQQLKLAVRTARDAQKRLRESAGLPGLDGDDTPTPDWKNVLTSTSRLLAETTKDLELATWLLEASIHLNGFAGLRDGFRLFRELSERYWDSLFPLADPTDGMEPRIQGLSGLNGLDRPGPLVLTISTIPLTDPGSGEPYARWHFQQAAEVSAIADPEKRQRRIEAGAVSMEDILRRVGETSPGTFADLREDLEGCLAEMRQLAAALEDRCGTDASGRPVNPSLHHVRQALEQCLEIAAEYAPPPVAPAEDRNDLGASSGVEARAGTDEAHASTSTGGGVMGSEPAPRAGIASREDAFQTLRRVADFFRRVRGSKAPAE